jgi:hypothetical protein
MLAIQPIHQNVEHKALYVEVNNPNESKALEIGTGIDECDCLRTQSLLDDLNILNAPVLLLIVPNTNAK